jgi:hypothetical protein
LVGHVSRHAAQRLRCVQVFFAQHIASRSSGCSKHTNYGVRDYARGATPWRVVFCKKLKKRNGATSPTKNLEGKLSSHRASAFRRLTILLVGSHDITCDTNVAGERGAADAERDVRGFAHASIPRKAIGTSSATTRRCRPRSLEIPRFHSHPEAASAHQLALQHGDVGFLVAVDAALRVLLAARTAE